MPANDPAANKDAPNLPGASGRFDPPSERAPRKEIFGWAMFDFANQAYTLLIMTVIYPVLFTTVIVGDADGDFRLGNLLWSVALSLSYIAVVLTGPVFGAIMDFSALKKRFLFWSYLATVFTTSLLYFVDPGMIILAIALLVLSNFAYAIGENFIAAFLPSLGPPRDLGKISGFGWAMGYVGGLASAVFVLLVLGEPTAENYENMRWIGPYTGVFFLLTGIPTFLWVKEPGAPQPLPSGQTYLSMGFRRMGETLSAIRRYKDLSLFLVSVFFSMAGVYIVISFAFIYGDQVVKWDESVRVLMFVVVQITAMFGALLFGYFQDRIGAKLTYNLSLGLWFLGVMGIFGVEWLTDTLNAWLGKEWEMQYVFVWIGIIAGTSMGSSQSASRALVGLFSPVERSAEFFGFWGLSNKIAAVFGIIGIGLLQAQVGLQRSLLFCAALFLVAIVLTVFVNQARGESVVRGIRGT